MVDEQSPATNNTSGADEQIPAVDSCTSNSGVDEQSPAWFDEQSPVARRNNSVATKNTGVVDFNRSPKWRLTKQSPAWLLKCHQRGATKNTSVATKCQQRLT
ncbi:hypothetical protein AVEN_192309-1 [Araneus ventricosus]|uniref:Uncharacterized protein n=1 Tax=Araneus ventricosus TaxID=182803 RepID=A0A4Y2JMB5_ARAVE|nr:hypothetical protein AVEN_192309-1 [Araneus ventricosus]